MVPSNIEDRLRKIIETKGDNGWIRSETCASVFAKDNSGKINLSERQKFYRWRKQAGKGKREGFQVQPLPGNVVYIGLASSDLNALNNLVSGNKRVERSVKSGFWVLEWLKYRDEKKRKQIDENIARGQCRVETRHARAHLRKDDPEFHKKVEEIKERLRKKYGLPYAPLV